MSEMYAKGRNAEKAVVDYLQKQSRRVEKSDNKTFDLIVDGRYAEVKSKGADFDRFDFITLTYKQEKALRDGMDFLIFLVCYSKHPEALDIREFTSTQLSDEEPIEYPSYEYSRAKVHRAIGKAAP